MNEGLPSVYRVERTDGQKAHAPYGRSNGVYSTKGGANGARNKLNQHYVRAGSSVRMQTVEYQLVQVGVVK